MAAYYLDATSIYILKKIRIMKMSVISWNCRGYLNKIHEICSIIDGHHSICLALQETQLKSSVIVKLSG